MYPQVTKTATFEGNKNQRSFDVQLPAKGSVTEVPKHALVSGHQLLDAVVYVTSSPIWIPFIAFEQRFSP